MTMGWQSGMKETLDSEDRLAHLNFCMKVLNNMKRKAIVCDIDDCLIQSNLMSEETPLYHLFKYYKAIGYEVILLSGKDRSNIKSLEILPKDILFVSVKPLDALIGDEFKKNKLTQLFESYNIEIVIDNCGKYNEILLERPFMVLQIVV